MLSQDTLKMLERAVGFEDMIRIVRMETILHTAKPVFSVEKPNLFEEKCLRKFSRLLGENELNARRAMARLFACGEYESRLSLEGLGGCVVIPLETLIAQADELLTGAEHVEMARLAARKRPR